MSCDGTAHSMQRNLALPFVPLRQLLFTYFYIQWPADRLQHTNC